MKHEAVVPGQPINLTPAQWQIFCHEGNRSAGWQFVAPALNKAANKAVRCYFTQVSLGTEPKKAMQFALQEEAVMVMRKHRKHGADDTEPNVVMVMAVNAATHNDFDRFEVL